MEATMTRESQQGKETVNYEKLIRKSEVNGRDIAKLTAEGKREVGRRLVGVFGEGGEIDRDKYNELYRTLKNGYCDDEGRPVPMSEWSVEQSFDYLALQSIEAQRRRVEILDTAESVNVSNSPWDGLVDTLIQKVPGYEKLPRGFVKQMIMPFVRNVRDEISLFGSDDLTEDMATAIFVNKVCQRIKSVPDESMEEAGDGKKGYSKLRRLMAEALSFDDDRYGENNENLPEYSYLVSRHLMDDVIPKTEARVRLLTWNGEEDSGEFGELMVQAGYLEALMEKARSEARTTSVALKERQNPRQYELEAALDQDWLPTELRNQYQTEYDQLVYRGQVQRGKEKGLVGRTVSWLEKKFKVDIVSVENLDVDHKKQSGLERWIRWEGDERAQSEFTWQAISGVRLATTLAGVIGGVVQAERAGYFDGLSLAIDQIDDRVDDLVHHGYQIAHDVQSHFTSWDTSEVEPIVPVATISPEQQAYISGLENTEVEVAGLVESSSLDEAGLEVEISKNELIMNAFESEMGPDGDLMMVDVVDQNGDVIARAITFKPGHEDGFRNLDDPVDDHPQKMQLTTIEGKVTPVVFQDPGTCFLHSVAMAIEVDLQKHSADGEVPIVINPYAMSELMKGFDQEKMDEMRQSLMSDPVFVEVYGEKAQEVSFNSSLNNYIQDENGGTEDFRDMLHTMGYMMMYGYHDQNESMQISGDEAHYKVSSELDLEKYGVTALEHTINNSHRPGSYSETIHEYRLSAEDGEKLEKARFVEELELAMDWGVPIIGMISDPTGMGHAYIVTGVTEVEGETFVRLLEGHGDSDVNGPRAWNYYEDEKGRPNMIPEGNGQILVPLDEVMEQSRGGIEILMRIQPEVTLNTGEAEDLDKEKPFDQPLGAGSGQDFAADSNPNNPLEIFVDVSPDLMPTPEKIENKEDLAVVLMRSINGAEAAKIPHDEEHADEYVEFIKSQLESRGVEIDMDDPETRVALNKLRNDISIGGPVECYTGAMLFAAFSDNPWIGGEDVVGVGEIVEKWLEKGLDTGFIVSGTVNGEKEAMVGKVVESIDDILPGSVLITEKSSEQPQGHVVQVIDVGTFENGEKYVEVISVNDLSSGVADIHVLTESNWRLSLAHSPSNVVVAVTPQSSFGQVQR